VHAGNDRPTAIRLFSVAAVLSACALTASCHGKSSTNSPTISSADIGSTHSCPPPSSPPPTTALFTGLHNGSQVSSSQLVSGVVSGIPTGMDTWLVVQPILAPQYWPQSGPILIVGGHFNAVVYFGAGADQRGGQEFNLLIVSAPQNASQRFQEFLQKPQAVGLSGLPGGARPLTEVVVKRNAR
jgi:hypothetical protein